jgi:hypothetical protein
MWNLGCMFGFKQTNPQYPTIYANNTLPSSNRFVMPTQCKLQAIETPPKPLVYKFKSQLKQNVRVQQS